MSAVARRYAKAVFALAQEQHQIEAVGQQLLAAMELLATPPLPEVIASPLLAAERRRAIVRTVSQQLALSPVMSTFLLLLADRRRLDQMASIADHYQRLEDRALGRVRLLIRSAVPLSENQRTRIADAFQRMLGRTVLARVEVEPALLGGVIAEAEGKVYDGSVRTQLERLGQLTARRHRDS